MDQSDSSGWKYKKKVCKTVVRWMFTTWGQETGSLCSAWSSALRQRFLRNVGAAPVCSTSHFYFYCLILKKMSKLNHLIRASVYFLFTHNHDSFLSARTKAAKPSTVNTESSVSAAATRRCTAERGVRFCFTCSGWSDQQQVCRL